MTFFVYPITGPVEHGIYLTSDGSTISVPLGDRFMPPDEARFEMYQIDLGGPLVHWRSSTHAEADQIIHALMN